MKKRRSVLLCMLVIFFILPSLNACDGNGEEETSPKWDQEKWDKDKWK